MRMKLALLYLILRLIDAAAQYYMANMGHIMGVYIEMPGGLAALCSCLCHKKAPFSG